MMAYHGRQAHRPSAFRAALPEGQEYRDRADRRHSVLPRAEARPCAARRGPAALDASNSTHHRRCSSTRRTTRITRLPAASIMKTRSRKRRAAPSEFREQPHPQISRLVRDHPDRNPKGSAHLVGDALELCGPFAVSAGGGTLYAFPRATSRRCSRPRRMSRRFIDRGAEPAHQGLLPVQRGVCPSARKAFSAIIPSWTANGAASRPLSHG